MKTTSSVWRNGTAGWVAAACAVAVAWTGLMIPWGGTDSPSRPAVHGQADADKVRDLLIRGGFWAWQAVDGCGRGPIECETTLTRINKEARGYGLVVFEDGSLAPVELVDREDGGTLVP